MYFTKINYNAGVDFWKENYHLNDIEPYKTYRNEPDSSAGMWYIVFTTEPDKEYNKYFHLPKSRVKELIYDLHGEFDDTDPKFILCEKKYALDHLTPISRSVKDYGEFLEERSRILRELTREEYLSNMKEYDIAISKSLKLFEEFQQIQETFETEKRKARVRGGRNESKAERGEI